MKNIKMSSDILGEIIIGLDQQHKVNYSILREEIQPDGKPQKRDEFVTKLLASKLNYDKNSCAMPEEDFITVIDNVISSPMLLDDEAYCLAALIMRLDENL